MIQATFAPPVTRPLSIVVSTNKKYPYLKNYKPTMRIKMDDLADMPENMFEELLTNFDGDTKIHVQLMRERAQKDAIKCRERLTQVVLEL